MIYVNGRFLLQSLTGVNRFAYELCRAWVQLGIPFTLCCPPGRIRECYDVSRFRIIVCGWGKSHLWEQLALPFWFGGVKGEKILLCLTGLGPLLARRKIMTIHDLSFMANPGWYSCPYRLWYRLMTPLCAATSKKILTVSEFSKSEIVRRLSISGDKINVVYNAVSPLFRTANSCAGVGRERAGKERYILAVSSVDPRKNFRTLLKSFTHIKDKSIKLYIVGGQAAIYATSIADLCKESGSEQVRWLGRITDADLKWYYEHALCFVYPSLYEGFGIPPLEAMACGTPVIVSSIPPLKEVCGNAALYVRPCDEHDIAEEINRLSDDDRLRQDLIQKGYERCNLFDWRHSASLLVDNIREVMDADRKYCQVR